MKNAHRRNSSTVHRTFWHQIWLGRLSYYSQTMKRAFKSNKSLVNHEAIHWVLRMIIPVWLLANLGLFLSGHLTTGARVDLEITLAQQELPLRTFATFSLGQSLKEMAQAGAMPLAVFIGIFSGAWPYLKLVLLLYCWVVSPVYLPPARRSRWLQVLDILGKWSLIDIYVLVLTMLAFQLEILSPSALRPLWGDNFYSVTLKVTPVWGMYAFMLAAVSEFAREQRHHFLA